MNKEDYIKGATSKIFNHSCKKAVQTELADHILNAQGFNEEIGYEAEAAENLAVEKMGDYEEIAENLGALHNDFYTPIGDIIAFVIWLAGLGGTYYLLNKYIFGDFGAMPITLAAIFLSCAVFFISAGFMLRRNRLPVIIGNFLCGGATSVFIYFLLKNIIAQVYNNIHNLYELIVNSNIATVTALPNKKVAIALIVLSLFILLPISVSLIYYVKYHTNNNTLFDNHFKRFFKNLSFIVSIAFIICTVFFGYRFFTIQNDLYNEYKNAYQDTLNMCRECKTFDELSDYISSGKAGFIDEEKLDISVKSDETISGYYYSDNFIAFTVERDFSVPNEDYKFLSDYGMVPSDFPAEYDYEIRLALSTMNLFKNNLDSLSLKKYKASEEMLDEITLFDMQEHPYDDSIAFYWQYIPTALRIQPAASSENYGTYYFTYISGSGKFKFTNEFSIRTISKAVENVLAQEIEISEIIKNNLDCSYEEIAELTNTTLIAPNISYEDYASAVGVLGSYFDDYKENLLESYYSQYSFKVSDDLQFALSSNPYEYVTFTSPTKFEYFKIIPLTERAKHTVIDSEPFKKVGIYGKGYYAKNGLAYDYTRIPYFEENGTRYKLYMIDVDPGDMSGYIKTYYLVNEKSELYKADDCFIDSNGYLFIDTYHRLKVQDDGLIYSDSNGNTYTKALETSWDENGNILPFDKYLD
ncbi:MAG: hypothetical protein K2L19_08905 [Eubacterium sp.]|nr:hypothetical protein [Eubacterium sp.]